jgi:hypothetical protein
VNVIRKGRKKLILSSAIELEKTNSANINQNILNFLTMLHDGQCKFDKVRTIITDQTPYAVKVAG